MQQKPTHRRPSTANLLFGALIVLTLCKVWSGDAPGNARVIAQIPDSGLQRKQLIDEVRKTNQLLTQLLETVKTQTLKVRIEGTDKEPTAKRKHGG